MGGPQKHQKRAILHTSQANGEGSRPPAPPGYATVYFPGYATVYYCLLFISLSYDFLLSEVCSFIRTTLEKKLLKLVDKHFSLTTINGKYATAIP